MSPMTNATKKAVLDHLYGGGDYVRPASLWIGLSTTEPGKDGTNFTEPTHESYERVLLVNDVDTWNEATEDDPAIKTNKIAIEFPEATSPWGIVTHFGVFTEETGGVPMEWGALDASVEVTADKIVKFKIGELRLKLQAYVAP